MVELLRREFIAGLALLPLRPLPAFANGRQAASTGRHLTVADAIDTARFMEDSETWVDPRRKAGMPGRYVHVSPDGNRYVLMLVRGDLAAGGNWVEILVGGTASLDDACNNRIAAKLFTKSEGEGRTLSRTSPARLTFPSDNHVMWLDNNQVAFRWSRQDGVIQVVAVNSTDGVVRFLTDHPKHVLEWAASRTGTIIYSADVLKQVDDSALLEKQGFVVSNLDAYSLLEGRLNGDDFASTSRNEIWLAVPNRVARRIAFGQSTVNPSATPRNFLVSPDGRYALATIGVIGAPPSWDSYRGDWYGGGSLATAEMIRESRIAPNGIVAQALTQYWLIDLASAKSRPLWDAPRSGNRTKAAWSSDGRSIALGPTYLPPTQSAGLDVGAAVAVIDVESGHHIVLPVPSSFAVSALENIVWHSPGAVALESGNKQLRFSRHGQNWVSTNGAEDVRAAAPRAPLIIEVKQDLNTPPKVFARNSNGTAERLCFDPNPKLAEFRLGHVEHVTWASPDGTPWDGVLYLPAEYEAGRKYPTVIQTHGRSPSNEFSLYGNGFPLGPTWSAYAAQPLAGRNIAVLQANDRTIAGRSFTPEEPKMYLAAFEAAIDYLERRKIADLSKIALMGHSRSGWYVEYTLVHSDFAFAAALVADNMDASYMQATLSPHNIGEISTLVGAEPFGSGLKQWLEQSVGFNATRIQTPLRLQLETGGLPIVLGHWEVFSRLRQADLPVELFVIPDIEHGSHGIQNPRQCFASQQGAVDWFDFWLNGREDPAVGKRQQFERWRRLRELRDRALQRKRPPLLDWSSSVRMDNG